MVVWYSCSTGAQVRRRSGAAAGRGGGGQASEQRAGCWKREYKWAPSDPAPRESCRFACRSTATAHTAHTAPPSRPLALACLCPVSSVSAAGGLNRNLFFSGQNQLGSEQSAGGEASLAMLSSLVSNRAVLSAASSNTQGRGVPAYRPRPFSLPFPFLLQLAGRTRQLQSEEADCRGVRRF